MRRGSRQNILTRAELFWTTQEIPTKFLRLNQFENSPMMKHLFPFFDMVSGLHIIPFAWCVVLNVFLHLYNDNGFVQNL